MSDQERSKKIIVDEDWKSQVEAERQQQEEQRQEQPPTSDEQPQQQGDRPMEFPPASFGMLLTSLASEAMIALGQIPHPVSGETEVSLDHARYLIDTLAVLQTKTSGNLEADEQQALDATVSQLRMAFVAVKQSAGATEQS